jgi:hypothetical protein
LFEIKENEEKKFNFFDIITEDSKIGLRNKVDKLIEEMIR